MSVEAIIDTIHDFIYKKMNESRDSEEETKIKHVDRKRNYQNHEKKQKNSEKLIVSNAAHRTGANKTVARQKQRNV